MDTIISRIRTENFPAVNKEQ